jgi:hypothetical protein
MKDKSNNTYGNVSINSRKPVDVISPGSAKTFSCGIKMPNDFIISAKARASVAYKTAGVSRLYADRSFTWYPDATPPRWIESD